MGHDIRYLPSSGTLTEVTVRTIQQRYLLRPGPRLNQLLIGVLAHAQDAANMRVHAIVAMSTHFHLLMSPTSTEQMADFMCLVNTNLAKEAGRLHDWPGTMFPRRYASIPVSSEPNAQIARLRYLLSHGVKEHLVARCKDWPGVHAAEALTNGRALVGYWFDRTAEHNARLRGQDFGVYTHAKLEPLSFDPLPCWRHLDAGTYQTRVAELVTSIEADAATERRARGIAPLGVKAIQRQNAKRRPNRIKRSPAPPFHAASKRAWFALIEAYRWFEAAYREAAGRLREGDREAIFPEGSFLPSLPFVVAI